MATLSEFTLSVVILFTILITKELVQRVAPHQVFRYFSFYCAKLSNKVNKANNSCHQQKIAGVIASLITLLPVIIIIGLFENFIALPQLWHALLLYLAVDGLALTKVTKNIATELTIKNNTQAKKRLQPWVLRDVSKLSSIGLSKASIEMHILRNAQQLIAPCFYFLTLGPLAALGYRLVLEMHYSWNIKQSRFHHFGWGINIVSNILQWLPCRMMGFALWLTNGHQLATTTKAFFHHFFQLNNQALLAVFSVTLQCKLSGVAIYQAIKLRKPAVNTANPEPSINTLLLSNQKIVFANLLLASALIGCTLLVHSLSLS